MTQELQSGPEISDIEYYESRAEAEIAAAQAASHAAVVQAHYELAGHYLDRIHNPEAMAPEPEDRDRAGPAAGARIIPPSLGA